MMTVHNGEVDDGTNVYEYEGNSWESQAFRLKYDSTNNCFRITAVCAEAEEDYDRALYFSYADSINSTSGYVPQNLWIIDQISYMTPDMTYTFDAIMYSDISGENGQNGITWSVTNGTGSATIDSSTGVLTAQSTGTVTVRATCSYLNKSVDSEVTINNGWPVYGRPTMYVRSSWSARNVVESRLVPRTRKPERIIFHHSAEKFISTDITDIIEEIQRIQNLHMDEKNKCDIAYHFIIDPAGGIWRGAEIDAYQRGHATGYYDDIGVLILGDYESRLANMWIPDTLNQQQKDAMERLSKWLCYEYDLPLISSGQNIAPITTHRTVNPGDTVCPGENLASWIENELRRIINSWNVRNN